MNQDNLKTAGYQPGPMHSWWKHVKGSNGKKVCFITVKLKISLGFLEAHAQFQYGALTYSFKDSISVVSMESAIKEAIRIFEGL